METGAGFSAWMCNSARRRNATRIFGLICYWGP